MPLSAETLFHFTKYEYLKAIIEKKAFYPRYSFELLLNDENMVVALPMVCFCDIPLSQIYAHANRYNRNGIGLNKDWGKESGINPVFYLQEYSRPLTMLENMVKGQKLVVGKNGKHHIITTDPQILRTFLDLLSYFKMRKGKTWQKEKGRFAIGASKDGPYKITNFYDEREWRYVPDIHHDIKENRVPVIFIPKNYFYKNELFHNVRFRNANIKLERFPLYIQPDEVKYIIVSSTNLITNMVEFIRGLSEDIYTQDEKDLLYTKVISLTQIKEDF